MIKEGFEKSFILSAFLLILFITLINFTSAAITLISPASNTNYSGRSLVVFNVSYVNGTDYNDALNATFYYNLSGAWTHINFTTDCNNGATFGSCNITLNISQLTQGRYSINATIGNDTTKGSTLASNVVFDYTAPTVTINSPANNTNSTNSNLNVNYTVSDNLEISNCWYSNDSYSANTSLADCADITSVTWTTGQHNVTIWANDSSGNVNSASVNFNISRDLNAPNATFSCSPSTVSRGSTVTCSCTVTDTESGVNTSATNYTVNPSTADIETNTVYCYFADLAGNRGNVSTTYFVADPTAPASQTSSGTQTKTNSVTVINPGTAATVSGFSTSIGVKQIQIEVSNPTQNVQVTVTKYDSRPTNVSIDKSNTYKYLSITATNLANNLSRAVIETQVNKSWASARNLNSTNIALFKYNSSSSKWNELSTTFKSEDSTYYYYETAVTSFSYFAIAQKEASSQAGQQQSGQQSGQQPGEEQERKIGTWIWIGAIVLVAGLIGVVVFFIIKKRK